MLEICVKYSYDKCGLMASVSLPRRAEVSQPPRVCMTMHYIEIRYKYSSKVKLKKL